MAQAREYVEEILPSLNLEGTVDVFYEFDIYWVCWRVLKSLDDVRSQQILEKAHQRLYEQAERILDQELQLSYLCGVPAHREILVAWEQAQAK